MINVESKLLNALEQSTCFGIAHDETVPECKQCDVKAQCKGKTELGIPTPTPKSKPAQPKPATPESKPKPTEKKTSSSTKPAPKADKPKSTASKPKSTPAPSGDTPDFKSMDLPTLVELAGKRNVQWKDYGNENITRMRLIMALKKTY